MQEEALLRAPYTNVKQLVLTRIENLIDLDLSYFHFIDEVIIERVTNIDLAKLNLGSLKNIKHLSIKSIPLEGKLDVSTLENIQRLEVSKTDINQIALPPSDKLTYLDLSHNKLSSLPSEVALYPLLTTLIINNNQLNTIVNFSTPLLQLKTLSAHSNLLTSIKQNLQGLINLQTLYISHNNIGRFRSKTNLYI